MRSTLVSRACRSGLLLFAAALIVLVNCEQVDVTAVEVARVTLSPLTATVAVSQTTRFTVTVLSSSGQTLSGRTVDWDSDAESIALVDQSGLVRGLSPGTATIRATSGGAIGTSTVTVTPAPELVIAPTDVAFSAVQSGSTPGDRTVSISNAGTGTVSGLTVAIRYAPGDPTGWLTATLAGTTTPTTLLLSVNQGNIPLGTYTATVDVSAVGGSTRSVTVRLTVITPAPAITLGATTASFGAAQGGADPVAQNVGVTNAGGGSLTGLSTTITYTAGQPTGWLAASLSSPTAPATLTLRATTGALAPGAYTATVRVSSAVAQNSPQTLTVTFTVGGPQAAIGVDRSTLNFLALRGGTNPAAQTVQVTNIGGSPLTGLAISVTYPGGQPSGWLTMQLSSTTAPATITVGAITGALSNGTYTASVNITSPAASNSPQQVQVNFLIAEPPPSAPANLTAASVSATQVNLSWSAAAGSVARYLIERRTGTTGNYAAIDSVFGGTVTYQNTGLTPATTYSYRVRACNNTGCSTYTAEAFASTLPLPPSAPAALSATAISTSQINLSWTAATGTVASYRVERSTTSGSGFTEIASLPNTATTFANTGLTPNTAYYYRMRACNTGGCSAYTAEDTAQTVPLVPGAPSNLTATAVSATQINLSWSAATGTVDSYRVERTTTSGTGFAEISSLANTATTYANNTGLAPNTAYFYRVRACNATGCSTYTTQAQDTTFPLPPGAPSNFTATTASSSQINLSWSAASGTIASYRVERSTTAGTGFTEIASLANNATTFANNTGLAPGTTYFYRMRACNTGGCSAYTAEASAVTLPLAPGAPSGLTATSVSASQINLSWSAATGTIDSYRVERSTTAGSGFTEIASLTNTATTFGNNTGLAPGTTYFYRVRACNTGGCSTYTAEASATTLPLPPGAPSALTATTVSSAQINLSWTAATGSVDNYRVERSTTSGSGFAEIATVVSATTYQSTGLVAATQYFFRVRACNAAGCSAYTAEANATTAPPPPGTPGSFTLTVVSGTQIDVKWSAATGAVTTYNIERRLSSGGGFTEIAVLPSNATTYQNTGLTPTTAYIYRMRACNAGACSGYTAQQTATTLIAPPPAPSGLVATTVSASQINLSWSAATGTIDSYRVERSTTPGTGFTEIASLANPATTFQNNTGLAPNTTYYYRVRACNNGGCSAYTAEASAQTLPLPPAAPSGLTATAVSSTQIDLSWTAATGTVTSYHVERSITSGSGFAEIASVTVTTFQSTGLAPATPYFYRVRACNAGGCSAYTPEASATTLPPPPGAPTDLTATAVSASAPRAG